MIKENKSANRRIGESKMRRSSYRFFLHFSLSPFLRCSFFEIGLIIALFVFSHSQVWGYDWKYYGTNENGWYFYDIESVTRFSGDHLKLYVQSIYTEEGISRWVENGGKEFQSLDFSLLLSEYHCAERSVRHLNILFYSKDQKIFYPIKNDEWQLFLPDPMPGALFKELCK